MAKDEPDKETNPSLTQTLTNITSVSSSDQKTAQKRFSFYDAQEVLLQCGEMSGAESTTPPEEEEKQNLHRFNFYDPTLVADENTPIKSKNNNTITSTDTAISQQKQQQKKKKQQVQTQQVQQEDHILPKFKKKVEVESNLSPVTDVGSNSNEDDPQPPIQKDNDNNTEEILRSLQETEDQRMQILKTASSCGNDTTTNASSSSMETAATITEANIVAATAGIITTSPGGVSDNDNDRNNNMNNPYEDSIRAALTLLRKHKSSPHSQSFGNISTKDAARQYCGVASTENFVSLSYTQNNNNNNNNVNINPNHQSERRDRTPKEQDRLMQYRSYDEDDDVDYKGSSNDVDETLLDKPPGPAVDDAVQEAKLKSKQRQERMAKYASRLQEFKSNLAPEQQLELQISSSYQSFEQDMQDQDESSSRIESAYNNHGDSNSNSPNHIHHAVKSSLTDSDSVGLVSELSQFSNQQRQPPLLHSQIEHTHPNQQVIIEEQVQKGVEKVLVAILEASKSKSVNGDSSCRSTRADNMSTHSGDNVSDALLQVLDEVLHPSRSVETSINSPIYGDDDYVEEVSERTNRYSKYNPNDIYVVGSNEASIVATTVNKHSVSVMSQESTNSRSRKSSVVDELLAEIDDDEIGAASVQQQPLKASTTFLAAVSGTRNPPPISSNSNAGAALYWAEDEKKMTEDSGYSESLEPITMGSSSTNKNNRNTVTVTNNFDNEVIVVESIDASLQDSSDESKTSGDEDDLESVSSDSSDDEDEDDGLNTELDEDESYDDDDEEHRGGVLGPLSRGGTTGVVLDVESDSPSIGEEKPQKGYFSSVVNYVASALTPDEQRILDNRTKEEILANYDAVGTSTEDKEAFELMRTLCAHLLPFEVDQKSNWEKSIPVWDDENPNEAGYRIIRLSKSQLRRVECSFDAMRARLKRNLHCSLNGPEGQFNANFIQELEEAERLLDDEEKRNVVETKGISTSNAINPHTPSSVTNEEDCIAATSHPEFPGVKGAGQGEMGDLEYFQLPIIFKSHVTGFEPTKDMVLEPGNVIAGQYLVESELGSAAFSTAYRCIDLSSDDNDGHEEVCLKVIKNTKDFFDQSLDEIKILELLRQTGKCDENYILRVKTFFYYREHLIIVTELLRQNLFEFGKFILDKNEEPYFTLPRLAYITRQCLVALRFVHNLGLVHSDVKPENILLGSYSRAQIKLIDFGSSCYLTDRQSSYIQSRSYRAPEVVLGLPYDGKIDVWSLGCVIAEMYTGEVTFQNDSIVSMLSRIEAFRGSFPRHMIAQGRQCDRFFTKSGLLYELVDESDRDEATSGIPPGPDDEESDSEIESEKVQFDIFQPKSTRLSSRLGFDADLMNDYGEKNIPLDRQIEQMFTDFIAKLLTIDPDSRPSAEEALNHPWMLYASSLTDDQIKYPCN